MSNTKTKSLFKQPLVMIAGIIFSGSCWYFSNGLSGDLWYLLWIAPIPVLLISLNNSGKPAFFISAIAYLIGRLSWFSYLVKVATIIPAIVFTILLSLIFALIIWSARKIILKGDLWYTVFAFPVLFTTFEFLLSRFSADGTAGSIAYSQSDFLPVVQIASVTGIMGITFLVTFIPSAISVCVFDKDQNKKKISAIVISIIIIASSLLFGVIRINNNSDGNSITAGIICLNEKMHEISNHPDFQKAIKLTAGYTKEISDLASQGAQIIVLPERAINIGKENDSSIINILSSTAKQDHVFIVTGYTNFKNPDEKNSCLVIDADGNIVTDYNKIHLVTGFENQFTPGKEIGLFKYHGMQAGTAVCKDLDFQKTIRDYGVNDVIFLCVPAWDFIKDDWLHSRMAILRGVENGFSEIRSAREGRLTISDYYGKVNYEVSSAAGNKAELIGKVSLQRKRTIYARFGDWFGVLNLIAAICFIVLILFKRSKTF